MMEYVHKIPKFLSSDLRQCVSKQVGKRSIQWECPLHRIAAQFDELGNSIILIIYCHSIKFHSNVISSMRQMS
jgi:hypothetical protein